MQYYSNISVNVITRVAQMSKTSRTSVSTDPNVSSPRHQ